MRASVATWKSTTVELFGVRRRTREERGHVQRKRPRRPAGTRGAGSPDGPTHRHDRVAVRPGGRDIAQELTSRQVKLNLGGPLHDPTDPGGAAAGPPGASASSGRVFAPMRPPRWMASVVEGALALQPRPGDGGGDAVALGRGDLEGAREPLPLEAAEMSPPAASMPSVKVMRLVMCRLPWASGMVKLWTPLPSPGDWQSSGPSVPQRPSAPKFPVPAGGSPSTGPSQAISPVARAGRERQPGHQGELGAVQVVGRDSAAAPAPLTRARATIPARTRLTPTPPAAVGSHRRGGHGTPRHPGGLPLFSLPGRRGGSGLCGCRCGPLGREGQQA